jgi:Phosphoadenosine phosphosulfate reductase family
MQDRMTSESRHILSFGCGVNTAALMVLLIRKKMPFDEAVFADTGGELPETYEYFDIAERYLARHDVPINVVRSGAGTLYDKCKRRAVIPSKMWRWSTRDFKVHPIHRYYKSLNQHINEYLGIAYDEVERMKASREPYITSLFPLVDFKIDREECIRIIRNAGLPVPVKSGCYFCPFNNVERWKAINESHPNLYRKAIALEEGSKHFPSQRLTPRTLRGLRKSGFIPLARGEVPDAPCGAYCMA